MTVYELNKQGYASLPDMTEENLEVAKKDIILPFLAIYGTTYYMLLNNETHYYTVFTYKGSTKYPKMANEVLDIVKELGHIKSIEQNGSVIEFWITDEDECRMYVLFDYRRGVIEV